jgi:hypothetical protein
MVGTRSATVALFLFSALLAGCANSGIGSGAATSALPAVGLAHAGSVEVKPKKLCLGRSTHRVCFIATSKSEPLAAGGTTVIVPAVGTYNLAVTFPATDAGAGSNVTVALATQPPAGAPKFTLSSTVLAWVAVSFSSTVTFNAEPSFELADSSSAETTASQYDLSFLNASASSKYTTQYEGPAYWQELAPPTILRFTGAPAQNTFAAGDAYVFPVYATQNEKEYSLFPAGYTPTALTVGGDKAIWFAAGSAIGRITTAGYISLYPLPQTPTALTATDVATDNAGNVWFSTLQNVAGEITMDAKITTYTFTAPWGSAALGGTPEPHIALGPDGAMWLTADDYIGRITAGSAAHFYKLGCSTSGAVPYAWDIASFNGYLWVAGNSLAQMARVSTTGTVKCVDLPSDANGALGLTVARDNLWFLAAGKLSSMNAAQTFAQIAQVGPAGAYNDGAGLAADANGNLYYNAANASIVRLGANGVTSQYTLPELGTSNATPGVPIRGPDGALWFSIGTSIGRLQIP